MLLAQTSFSSTALGASISQAVTVTVTAAGTTNTNLATAVQVLTQGIPNLDYQYLPGGTCAAGMMVTVGQTCTVNVQFAPAAPGQRLGAVVLLDNSATPVPLATAYLQGIGNGPLAGLVPGMITTVAGNGAAGYGDGLNTGPAISEALYFPSGVAVDAAGNIYISDTDNYVVRKVSAASGTITTIAGTGNLGATGDGGPATNATLSGVTGLALDGAGNLYIADTTNCRIRKITAATGVISTVAGNGIGTFAGDGGAATSGSLNHPNGVAVDGAGNLYIADTTNARVREVFTATGMISTVAGNGTAGYVASQDGGPATSAELTNPWDVKVDAAGNFFIADPSSGYIRKVTAASGYITTVAGSGTKSFGGDGGPATSASFYLPEGLALDAAGDLFIADTDSQRIREIAASTEIINTVAGNAPAMANTVLARGFSGDGGPATEAALSGPVKIAIDGAGNLYFADVSNHRIRKITAAAAPMSFAATNVGSTSYDSPQTLTIGNVGNLPLTLSAPSTGTNPGLTPGFTMGSASTCPQLTSSSAPATLVSGGSCTEVVSFVPNAVTTFNGSLTVADNSGALTPSPQVVSLVGTGLATGTPVVASLSPTYGVPTGGTLVTITGSNFTGATGVSFGTATATNITVVSPTQITAISPPYAINSVVDVTVTNPVGTSPTRPSDQYSYLKIITFPQPMSPIFQGTTLTLNATASNGDPVLLNVTNPTGAVEFSNETPPYQVDFIFAGTWAISATSAATSTANAAPMVVRQVQVMGQAIVVGNTVAGSGPLLFLENGSLAGYAGYGGVSVAADRTGQILGLDSTGSNLWVTEDVGQTLADYGNVGLSGAKHLAIDGDNHVWIANGNGTLSLVTDPALGVKSGNLITSGAVSLETVAVSGLSTPSAIAIDLSGNVWVPDSSNDTINEVIGAAGPALPLVNAVVKVTPGTRP